MCTFERGEGMEPYKNRVCQAKAVPCSFQVENIVLERFQPMGEVGKVDTKCEGSFKGRSEAQPRSLLLARCIRE